MGPGGAALHDLVLVADVDEGRPLFLQGQGLGGGDLGDLGAEFCESAVFGLHE